ncbi:MAG: hypothetical protein ACI843_001384 [Psychrobacter glaciei]|jgi:hypothetical protein
MRWIFFSLLLVNLSYLAYEFSQPEGIKTQETVDVSVVSGAAPIKLLTELKQPETRKVVVNTDKKSPLCWAVGPYQVELDAQNVYARMLAVDIPASVDKQLVVVKEEFWVYLPPLSNKKQAIRKLKELQKREIDSFIITEGELANGISLGLFSKQSSVDRLVSELKKKRIEPSIKPLQRTRGQYWVTTPVNKEFSMDENTQKRLTDGRKVDWRQIRCESNLPQG